MEAVSWVVPSYSLYVTTVIDFILGATPFYGYIQYTRSIIFLGHSLLSVFRVTEAERAVRRHTPEDM